MRISEDTAFYIQTAAGGITALAGTSLSLLSSFGHVCYVRNDAGQYTLDTQAISWKAAAVIAGAFFYTGFSLTGKVVRRVCDIDRRETIARAALYRQDHQG